MSSIRAVPGINRGGWDVQRDNPDGTITVLAAGLRPQQARDIAEELRSEQETAHLMSSEKNAMRLMASVRQVRLQRRRSR